MPNARRTQTFSESVIREMSRVAQQYDAINLAQGFPDFPMPDAMKDAACDAVRRDINQYAITWGAKPLRDAIASKYDRRYGLPVDPEREITVTCGATEAMASVFLALFNPGDEVLIFEPFYENYGPDAILCDAKPSPTCIAHASRLAVRRSGPSCRGHRQNARPRAQLATQSHGARVQPRKGRARRDCARSASSTISS